MSLLFSVGVSADWLFTRQAKPVSTRAPRTARCAVYWVHLPTQWGMWGGGGHNMWKLSLRYWLSQPLRHCHWLQASCLVDDSQSLSGSLTVSLWSRQAGNDKINNEKRYVDCHSYTEDLPSANSCWTLKLRKYRKEHPFPQGQKSELQRKKKDESLYWI